MEENLQLKAKIKALEEELERERERNRKQSRDNADEREDIERMLRAAKRGLAEKDEELKELQSTVDKLKQSHDELKSASLSLENSASMHKKESEERQKTVNLLKQELEEMKTNTNKLDDELAYAEKEIERANEMGSIARRRAEELQQKNNSLKDNATKLTEKLLCREKEFESEDSRKRVEELRERMRELEKNATRLEETLSRQRERHVLEIRREQDYKKCMTDEIKKLKEKNEDMEKKHRNEVTGLIDNYQKAMKHLCEKHEKCMTDEIEKLKEKNEDMEKKHRNEVTGLIDNYQKAMKHHCEIHEDMEKKHRNEVTGLRDDFQKEMHHCQKREKCIIDEIKKLKEKNEDMEEKHRNEVTGLRYDYQKAMKHHYEEDKKELESANETHQKEMLELHELHRTQNIQMYESLQSGLESRFSHIRIKLNVKFENLLDDSGRNEKVICMIRDYMNTNQGTGELFSIKAIAMNNAVKSCKLWGDMSNIPTAKLDLISTAETLADNIKQLNSEVVEKALLFGWRTVTAAQKLMDDGVDYHHAVNSEIDNPQSHVKLEVQCRDLMDEIAKFSPKVDVDVLSLVNLHAEEITRSRNSIKETWMQLETLISI